MAEYLQFLMRYLDQMTPGKRGKALIDSELLRRIKLILALQLKDSSGSGETSSDSESAPPVPYGAGGSWDTQTFRRWVQNHFVYRPATRTELERAIDFGLLSPPESSLSGPSVPGHTPSAGLTRPMNLVFHEGRPVALRSRIYKIILRAHWITNHAGRDKTWATVREVCSYIPKCLVYDFVSACPMCRVARSRQYGVYPGITRRVPVAGVEKLRHGSQSKGDKGPNVEGGPPPILPVSSYGTPPEGLIPRFSPNGFLHPYPVQILTHPLWHLHRRHEINGQIVADTPSDLPFGSLRLPPLQIPPSPTISIPWQTTGRSQQPRDRDLRETQRETQIFDRRYSSWGGISKLIERAARNEDLDALVDSPAVKKGGRE